MSGCIEHRALRLQGETLATLYDVAKIAGVSPKTVSRVVTGDTPVRADKRQRVEAAIAQLNYVPSNAARSMRSNKSGLIGMITSAITMAPKGRGPSGLPDIFIVQGIQHVLGERGLTLLISDTGDRAERAPRLIRTFLEHRVEGLIYIAGKHQEVTLPGRLERQKVLLVNCFDTQDTPSIVPGDTAGAYALTAGLIARGHRRIAYLTPPRQLLACTLRLAGYRRALADAGIAFDPQLVCEGETLGVNDATGQLQSGIAQVLSGPHPATVICCGNDKVASQIYPMLAQRGLQVGRDISVAGYDDYRLVSERLEPQLTSVELPFSAMGIRAAKRILAMIAGDDAKADAPRQEIIEGPVIWRASVAVIEAWPRPPPSELSCPEL